MKNILFFTSVLLSLFIGGCKKSYDTYHYLSDKQKAMARFKVGSYWLMRDSITGRLDSFAITYMDKGFDSYAHSAGENYYEYIYYYYCQYENNNKKYYGSIDFKGDTYETIDVTIGPITQISQSSECIIHYFSSKMNDGYNVTINNNAYKNVYIANSKTNTNFLYDTISYFETNINADKILLKVIYQNDTVNNVWELEKAVLKL